ncbi:MAG: hypothetical protein DHS20C20_30900 [Ardenticatenaceae bacterium]|nr:MAG: hypothetical protein DHS20C20_30900 [Ardenticatenaceae bacterium]
MSNENDASGRALVEHWDWAANKGLMNKNTAGALRAASAQVLGVLDNWEDVDVREINIDDVFLRFQNLRGRDYKPKTLNVYKRRFQRAIDYFLEYLDDPSNWQPIKSSSREPTANGKSSKKLDGIKGPLSPKGKVPENPGGDIELIQYPFPLREKHVAYLNLPADLTVAEVRRLAAYMMTLTTDFEPENLFK